jgi:PKD repeat protein
MALVIPVAAAPVFGTISPISGPTSGGTPVTITGTDFIDGISFEVTIGGTNATGVYVNPTTITATTPAHATGAVDVVITNGDGLTDAGAGAFTYVAPPTFSSITPNTGPTSGGTAVSIVGTNFVSGGAFGVTIGGAPATSVVWVSATQITAVTPAGTTGTQNVVITNNDGQTSSGGVGAFTYEAGPTFTSITPNTGSLGGGTAVSIVGTNFVSGGAFGVTIGGAPATSVVRVNASHITAITPHGTAGAHNVVITNNDGQTATGTGAFTYVAGPVFGTITPNTGPTTAGTSVTITGSNFISGGSFGVTIGGANAVGVYINSTTITATTPAHAAGAVNVVITNNDGQTATGTGAFTYAASPVAAFSGTPTSGPRPLNVQFSDESTGVIDTYNWDFGDGHTSSQTNPSHNYPTIGSYTVNLTVTGIGGSNSTTKTGYITVGDVPPVAGFSGTPTSGQKPLNVAFTDASTGNVSSYSWDFGDGNTSILKDPSHIYSAAGSYTVTLTVTGPGGSVFESKINYITVTNGTTKIGIYKAGIWHLDLNGNGGKGAGDSAYSYGLPGWLAVIGNWNGDTKTEVGVYKDGAWYLDTNGDGAFDSGDSVYLFGLATWNPVVGNWNGDTKTEVGVYKDGAWYLDTNGDGVFDSGDSVYLFGLATWNPVVGDWNGDGKTEVGVYKDGVWYLDTNGDGAFDLGDSVYLFGLATWNPVVGNWNGDTKTEVGVYNDGAWYLDTNGDGAFDSGDSVYLFGLATWNPVVGNWNGDGKTEVGVYKDGVWYLDNNGDGVYNQGGVNHTYTFRGEAGWTPIVGDWNGNRTTKIGVYKDISWYLDYNGNGIWDGGDKASPIATVGSTKPVVGDWNGDGKTKVGYYRWGFWSLDYNGGGTYTKFLSPWFPGDDGNDILSLPVVGDWNGNGKTKIGIYRGGTWYLDLNGNDAWDGSVIDRQTYLPGSTQITGDWNGDGKSKIGVFNNGAWRLDYDGNGIFRDYSFGTTGSLPIMGDWNGDGKSKIGVFNNGAWLLDYNGNGVWEAGTDKEYSFGDSSWLPVVGKWT